MKPYSVPCGLVVLFLCAAGLVQHGAVFGWERDLLSWVQACSWYPVGGFLRGVSSLGDGWTPVVLIILTVLVLSRYRLSSEGFLMAAGIASGNGLTALFKWMIARPRPEPELSRLTELPGGFGFPSGHVFLSVAFIGFLGVLVSRYGSPPVRRAALAAALVLIATMGVSRVWLGVHWPLDVVGGYLLGALWLWFMDRSYRRLQSQRAIELS